MHAGGAMRYLAVDSNGLPIDPKESADVVHVYIYIYIYIYIYATSYALTHPTLGCYIVSQAVK